MLLAHLLLYAAVATYRHVCSCSHCLQIGGLFETVSGNGLLLTTAACTSRSDNQLERLQRMSRTGSWPNINACVQTPFVLLYNWVPVNVHLEVLLNAGCSSNDWVNVCAVIGIFVQILVSLLEGIVLVPLGASIFKTVTCSREQRVYCENFSSVKMLSTCVEKEHFKVENFTFLSVFIVRIQTALFIVWSRTGFLKFSNLFCHWKWTLNFEIMSIQFFFLFCT
jgi:hypothetical protein